MAYCNKCGAYIPDGQTGCLACGYDEAEKSSGSAASFSAAAAAAAQSFSEEVRKKVAEEKQRIREEEEKRRIRQENDRKWAEEEYRRRQQEKQTEAEEGSSTEGSYTAQRSYTPGETAAQPNKLLAALSYLSFLWILPFIFCRDDEYAKFHAKQGIRLFVLSLFSDIASLVPVVGAVFTLFRFYCIYKGMTNASAGKREALPYIGNIGRF